MLYELGEGNSSPFSNSYCLCTWFYLEGSEKKLKWGFWVQSTTVWTEKTWNCTHNFLNAQVFASTLLRELHSYNSKYNYTAITTKTECFSVTEKWLGTKNFDMMSCVILAPSEDPIVLHKKLRFSKELDKKWQQKYLKRNEPAGKKKRIKIHRM